MNAKPSTQFPSLIALSLGLCSVLALGAAPTTRPAAPARVALAAAASSKAATSTQAEQTQRAALRARRRDIGRPLPSQVRQAAELPPLPDISEIPLPRLMLPENARFKPKARPIPERPFLMPPLATRPRSASSLPAPAVESPSALANDFSPIEPMRREYIPATGITAIPANPEFTTHAEFDGVSDDDPPAIRPDLPSRPQL